MGADRPGRRRRRLGLKYAVTARVQAGRRKGEILSCASPPVLRLLLRLELRQFGSREGLLSEARRREGEKEMPCSSKRACPCCFVGIEERFRLDDVNRCDRCGCLVDRGVLIVGVLVRHRGRVLPSSVVWLGRDLSLHES